jgi:ribonuclease-3
MDLPHIRQGEMNRMETIEEYVKDLLVTDSDGKILAQALTPKSAGVPNNERLEFLGNAVLNMRVAEAIFDLEQEFAPGTMSLMCNYLRSNPVLVMAGREGGLAVMLAMHHGDAGAKVTDKMVSTAFEAIVGMLYQHVGYEAASGFIDRFLLTDDLLSGSTSGKGPITDLKELVDRNRELVVTHNVSERTEDGQLIFRHTTTINGRTVEGEGRTKKKAEAIAAVKALKEAGTMDVQ